MADILFVNATNALAVNQEVNGTLLLATKLLQAGFDAEVLRFCQVEHNKGYTAFVNEFTDRILEIDPKCVSFYTLWPHYHMMLRIAIELKKRDRSIVIVFGGPYASATAKATMDEMDCVDYICTGEGENTVVPFFKAVLEENSEGLSSIPGLYYRKDGAVAFNDMEVPLSDLNTLPYWDDRLYLKEYKDPEDRVRSDTYYMPIDVGRGCPFSCTFCCTSRFWHRTYRLKSPERIVDDILYYNQKFGIRSFSFSHDAFTVNNKLVSRVCDYLLEKGLDIRWKCTARIDCVTEELILKMKQAGMTAIEMGIETGSARMQTVINKKLNLERAKRIVSFLLENKIHVSLFFMYGFPEETEQDLSDTLELLFSMVDAGVNYVSMSYCRFNPATAITKQYFDELVLDPDIKTLQRGVYGYEEELQMFKEHKAVFPYLYHLHSPVRDDYQYLCLLVYLYRNFPHSIRYLRKLYNGDHLRFYRDFYNCNLPSFEKNMAYAIDCVKQRPVELLDNMMDTLDVPYIRQLKARLRFDYNVRRVSRSEEDISLRETYDFSYIDYALKRPIEQYSAGKTEILLQKVNGVMDMKVLRVG